MNRPVLANNSQQDQSRPLRQRIYVVTAALLLLALSLSSTGCRSYNQCGAYNGPLGLGLLNRPLLQRPLLQRPLLGGGLQQGCTPGCPPAACHSACQPAAYAPALQQQSFQQQSFSPGGQPQPNCFCRSVPKIQTAQSIGQTANAQGENYTVRYQSPDQDLQQNPQAPVDRRNIIKDVVIEGNQLIPTHHLTRNISTRPGRYFDPDRLQQDVDKLWRLPEIRRVNGPYIHRTSDGVIVTISVEERHRLNKVEFVGNRGITDHNLKKEIGIEDGQPLDMHQVRMAKTKIEDFYQDKGYPRTQVEIVEGDQQDDQNVVFLIHEDQKQRIWDVEFEGNEIASDARLRHFIESKPGILKVIGGLVKRDEIQQDILRLTNYYRSLGFFNARIGREVTESADGRWLTLRFIIDEGPRYRVRNISFIGNNSYQSDDLIKMLALKPSTEIKGGGQPEFNVAKMNADVVSLRDLYGSQGFVFAKVEAAPRFLEEPGLLDLVYKIDEGKQYRVGQVNVHIEGDYGITRREVVLNRLSLRPGDLIDVRKIRNSKRRFGSAQIFAGAQGEGKPPEIVVRPPELRDLERMADRGYGGSSSGSGSRGSAPSGSGTRY